MVGGNVWQGLHVSQITFYLCSSPTYQLAVCRWLFFRVFACSKMWRKFSGTKHWSAVPVKNIFPGWIFKKSIGVWGQSVAVMVEADSGFVRSFDSLSCFCAIHKCIRDSAQFSAHWIALEVTMILCFAWEVLESKLRMRFWPVAPIWLRLDKDRLPLGRPQNVTRRGSLDGNYLSGAWGIPWMTREKGKLVFLLSFRILCIYIFCPNTNSWCCIGTTTILNLIEYRRL